MLEICLDYFVDTLVQDTASSILMLDAVLKGPACGAKNVPLEDIVSVLHY